MNQNFNLKKHPLAIALTLSLSSLSLSAHSSPASYNSTTEELFIDVVDLQSGSDYSASYSAVLKSTGQPLQFQLVSAEPIQRPGGNRAVFDSAAAHLDLPGVSIGNEDYHVQMDYVPGSNPMTFNTTEMVKLEGGRKFNRIATFPVYLNTQVDNTTVSEIVDVTPDGNTLIYTDGVAGNIGFVDITQPSNPKPLGAITVEGEPTSVSIKGHYALAAVNTSTSYTETSGALRVIDIATQTIVTNINLDGQPDSIATSPDGHYALIAIENERDEDLGDGNPPQAPGGFLVIVDMPNDNPAEWTTRSVSLEGIPALFPTDPEPEFVDINENNIAVVTLQENNHLVMVDLTNGAVTMDFSAGTVDLTQIDTQEEDPAIISLTDTLLNIPREPDGVSWMGTDYIATANEGDMAGGSRSFSIFDTQGHVLLDSGNSLDHQVVRLGHYPDGRSGNKGSEPENVDYGQFGSDEYLFVASERSSVVFAYNLTENTLQTLPATIGPEGIKAIPQRGLLVAAGEEDSRGDAYRSGITIYQLQSGPATYPTIQSNDRIDGTPIPWSALSGLAADPNEANRVYTIPDSFYQKSRIFTLDTKQHPAIITKETVLSDQNGLLAGIAPNQVNSDHTVNLDLEGITVSSDGGFWLVSEGSGTVGDANRPVTSLDLLIHSDAQGHIDQVVQLPASTNERQVRFGFEGVTVTGNSGNEIVYVAFQRSWTDDPENHVRLGRYDVAQNAWSFYYYPLDASTSPNGGWVGLSDITALGNDEFLMLERDNQANTDATIKRIYRFSIAGLTPLADPEVGTTPAFPVVEKHLLRDLLPDMKASGGLVLEKVEGMTVTADKTVLVVNDNDGVDDTNGETQLIRLKGLIN